VRVLQAQVEERFVGRLFAVPSRVYSAPLLLYPGADIERLGLIERLHRLNYHAARGAEPEAGEYLIRGTEIELALRAFDYPYESKPERRVVLGLRAGTRISTLRNLDNRDLDTVLVEPELIGQFHGAEREDRRLIQLEELPPHLLEAVLSIEDREFYSHGGLRLWRIVGAAAANLRAGRIVQGGSTLTQQLVKNFYLSADRTLSRKLSEAVMALQLERTHDKDEILEAYLNEIYMGQRGSVSIHGMGEAAYYYFAKAARDLSLSESALLAGVIKGPSLYAPYRNPDRALQRRDLVLEVLYRDRRISEEAYRLALAEPLGVRGYLPADDPAPYFVEHLRQDLARVYGDEILVAEGMRVFTTLDPRAQREARAALRAQLARLERDFPRLQRDSALQAALIAVVPMSGEIVALVGGRDYRKSQFNRVTQARRQPGSAFKPVVALAALSRDPEQTDASAYTLRSLLQDEPLELHTPNGVWSPANYDKEFRGAVTLREAIEHSLNVPVVRLGLAVGAERIIRTARRMGIRSPLSPVPSLALGTFEVTPLEMASAYAVLATGGLRPELRSYAEVVSASGDVLDHKRLDFQREFDPAEVYLVTSLLEGAVERGTARGGQDWNHQ